MSVRCSRSLVPALFAGALALALAVPAPARAAKPRSTRASLDVVNEQGDTIRIVRNVQGVTITREGIRIQGGDVIEHPARVRDRKILIRKHLPPGVSVVERDSGIVHISRPGSGDIVNMFQDVEVPAGKVVNGQVVAIVGDVRVYGNVEGDVVAVMGSVDVGDSARVGGEVVSVGGQVHAAPTAEIQGQQVSVPMFGARRCAAWLPAVASFGSLIFFTLLGALFSVLFPERLARISATVSRRTLLSLVMGLASLPLLPIVFVLLLITVVGIPVAFLLLLLYPLAAFVGYVASCALIGSRLRRRSVTELPLWPSATLGLAAVGTVFVVGAALSSLGTVNDFVRFLGFVFLGIGFLVGSISVLLGLGALLLSRLGQPARGAKVVGSPAAGMAGPGPTVAPGPAS